jgi:hypothetical protein
LPFFGFFVCDDCGEDHAIATGNGNGAVSLTGQSAGFNGDLAAITHIERLTNWLL